MAPLIKSAILESLHYSGLLTLYARVALSGKAVVLMYHRVLPRERQRNSFSSAAIVVTPETFDMHMSLVRRFLRPVSVQEFARLVRTGAAIPSGTCLVTFDDGWYDNHAFALPILQKHAVPAIVFVATDYIASDRSFWQERLARMLFLSLAHEDLAAAVLPHVGGNGLPATNDEVHRRRVARAVVEKLKVEPIETVRASVEAVTREIASHLDLTNDELVGEDRFMTWAEVNELQASGLVTIGSHTQTHVPLTKLDRETASRELLLSREAIRANTGSDCSEFAYPNGDFDDETVDLVRSAGYSIAFTTLRRHVTANVDPLRLARINVHEAATPTAAHMLGRVAGLS